jgi:glycerol-3-phosphate dehydrogenase
MVRFAARYEFARCVEDVLARRSRMLFTDARRTAACANEVARILRDELGIDPKWTNFAASRCSTHAWPRTLRFNPASRIAHRQKDL